MQGLRNGVIFLVLVSANVVVGEDWLQFKYDARHSGNVLERDVATPLGLVGAVPLTDAVFTAPVVDDGKVYVVDGSGVCFCIEESTLNVLWKFKSRGGKANCHNLSSPAISGDYLHFGTTAGSYYVLNKKTGKVIKEYRWGDPIFSCPAVAGNRVYIATFGSQVYALEPNGKICWRYDVLEKIVPDWAKERWNGQIKRRVTHLFLCDANIAVYKKKVSDDLEDKKIVVVSAGRWILWLEDLGNSAKAVLGHDKPIGGVEQHSVGMTIGEDGTVYRQILGSDRKSTLQRIAVDGKLSKVPYSSTGFFDQRFQAGLSGPSVRGKDVYRFLLQEGFYLSKHPAKGAREVLTAGGPSLHGPILLKDKAVYGSLDGRFYVVPLSGKGPVWSFKTAFDKPITAPPAVCNGRIYFGCEDGYLYILGPGGKASLPRKDLELWKIRSPLGGKFTDAKYTWFAARSNFMNQNSITAPGGFKPPFKLKWIRPYKGLHTRCCFGNGRMYTVTHEGQVFAVEQETGRLLWRRYFPGVILSEAGLAYYQEKLLVAQTGQDICAVRCLDASTGKLIWEVSHKGKVPIIYKSTPVVYNNVVFYHFYTPDDRPLVFALNLETGAEKWKQDFSSLNLKIGTFRKFGGDICLIDGRIFYSYGYGPGWTKVDGGATVSLDPNTGKILWSSTEYHIHVCGALSGDKDKLFMAGKGKSPVCLNAKDGSFMYYCPTTQPGGLSGLTVSDKYLFLYKQKSTAYLMDKTTGKLIKSFRPYKGCSSFSIAGSLLLSYKQKIFLLPEVTQLYRGPGFDITECGGGIASNGRIFYSGIAGGVAQVSLVCGEEAAEFTSPWEEK